MARCMKCNRLLPASGGCLYCGTIRGAEAVEDRVRRRPFPLRWLFFRLAFVAALGALAYFLLATPTGKELVQDFKEMVLSK
ncbi:MAG: hypothetical protein HY716_15230 [Planctomycetes bacterium]|nr:hypothetical protein [Planctomycetota bacterium]